jgi:uncharacterized protein (DUF1330 family)
MAAYLIADIEVTDAAAFERYRLEVPAVDELYGGKYICRGGATKVLEGDCDPHRLVVLEFADMTSLMRWYDSPEYAPLKAIRERSSTSRIVAVEGVG